MLKTRQSLLSKKNRGKITGTKHVQHAQTAEHTDLGKMHVTGAKGITHQTVFSILFVKRLSTVTKQTHFSVNGH